MLVWILSKGRVSNARCVQIMIFAKNVKQKDFEQIHAIQNMNCFRKVSKTKKLVCDRK